MVVDGEASSLGSKVKVRDFFESDSSDFDLPFHSTTLFRPLLISNHQHLQPTY
jgi:hypothetical protein